MTRTQLKAEIRRLRDLLLRERGDLVQKVITVRVDDELKNEFIHPAIIELQRTRPTLSMNAFCCEAILEKAARVLSKPLPDTCPTTDPPS